MRLLKRILPTTSDVILAGQDELGAAMLDGLVKLPTMTGGPWVLGNYFFEARAEYDDPMTPEVEAEFEEAVSTGWNWLIVNGLMYQRPNGLWCSLTRKGREAAAANQIREVVSSAMLPKEFLHPSLLVNARSNFLRGEFDTAVFVAFRALEVAIREAAGLTSEIYGKTLATTAFKPGKGALVDPSEPEGEQEALMQVAAGAIGRFKNPTSHRHVPMDAGTARDAIILASLLLKVVDARAGE